jgi:hypothetical protein
MLHNAVNPKLHNNKLPTSSMSAKSVVNNVHFSNMFFNNVSNVNDCTILFSTFPNILLTLEIGCKYYELPCCHVSSNKGIFCLNLAMKGKFCMQ